MDIGLIGPISRGGHASAKRGVSYPPFRRRHCAETLHADTRLVASFLGLRHVRAVVRKQRVNGESSFPQGFLSDEPVFTSAT